MFCTANHYKNITKHNQILKHCINNKNSIILTKQQQTAVKQFNHTQLQEYTDNAVNIYVFLFFFHNSQTIQ